MSTSWLSVAEKGSSLGVRFLVFACTVLGRPVARLFLKFVALYYVVFHGGARRASRRYLQRLHHKVTFAMIYRHVLNFAEVSLDRVFFLRGRFDYFKVGSNGFDNLRRMREQKRGALLLGAHLGSFEAMRTLAEAKSLPVNILTYRGNSKMMNAILEDVSPGSSSRFIEIEPGSVTAILRIKELIDAGEMVAVLGDRAELDANRVDVDFLGGQARFPTGVYLLASVLKCPIFLTFNLYRSPNRYDCYCEPFADKLELPRGNREAAIADHARSFARRLEHFCRMEPGNWFNFYDFWSVSR